MAGDGVAVTCERVPRAQARPARDVRPQFRLRAGRDDVLIEWLTSIAPRQRSQAIREALYDHLAGRSREGNACSEDPDLAAALDALF